MGTFTCKKCGEVKELNNVNFTVEKRTSLGFDTTCKKCRCKKVSQARKENPDKFKERDKRARESERYKNYHIQYETEHNQYLKECAKANYHRDKQPYLKRSKEQQIRLGDKYKQYQREYRISNRKTLSEKYLRRLKTDPVFKLKHSLRCRFRKLISGEQKRNSILSYIGCDIAYLKEWISAQFCEGMTWENHGLVWHIDHIIPCAIFDFSSETELQKCWNYTNLRPLFIVDNLSKSDKIDDTRGRKHVSYETYKKSTNNMIKTFLDSKDEGFVYKPVIIGGVDLLLITPKDMGTQWNDVNRHFRSSIINPATFKCVSRGFSKFTNFGESPAFEPWDNKWPFEATRKMDGSLLCISKMNGNIIARTRGVADATIHETGDEIEIFKTKYPFLFDNKYINNEEYTILCEHTTPNRIIVLREHDEPTLTLLAIVDNESGEYLESEKVDENAKAWNIPRPKYYYYSSISECIADVNMWRDSEGVVIRHGQILKKVKAEHYLTLHKLKSSIASLGNLLDVYLTSTDRGDYDSFYRFIETTMDYELAEACKDNMLKITQTNVEILAEMEEAKQFVSTLNGETRKDNAVAICKKYNDWRKGFCFNLLDGKTNIREKANLTDVFMNKMK